MVITPEQADQVKQHLLGQLENFPEDQQANVKQKILAMTPEEVEAFIKQNGLGHLDQNSQTQQCIFCAITEGKVPSYKIGEDNENLAILDINPLSKGHSLIIPKIHPKGDLPESTSNLAREISQKITERFKPLEIKINPQKIMDHAILEIVPLYGDETEKHKASEEELKQLQEELVKPSETPDQIEPKTSGVKEEPITVLKPRIP